MIKRILILCAVFVFLGDFALAKVTQLNYRATFGMFGTIGTIKNTLTQNAKTYKIQTKVQLAGIAKSLMGGQVEDYVSKGHMHNGLMISDTYTMTSTKKDKIVKKEYYINHKDKYVTKHYRKWRKGKLVKDKKEKLKFYAKDDLLTLYFNLGTAIKEKGKTYHFKAVGLEKQKGKVQITVPSNHKNAIYKQNLGAGAALYAKALIHQKNFKKKKGDIFLAIDKDGFIRNSVIKDVLIIGDAKLVRMK